MARPIKKGLDYFPLDVDFFEDDKIEAISGEFGIKGELVSVKLLCAIYRNGYFIEWSDLQKMKLLKRLPGVSAELLDQIVTRLVSWGFFERSLFDSANVLTSCGIQARYNEATKRRHETGVSVYAINNGVSANNNPVTAGNNVNNNAQSRVKEIKVKETKRANALVAGDPAPQLTEQKLRGQYGKLAEGIASLERKEAWTQLKDFIQEHRPRFIEPYVNLWNLFVTGPHFSLPEVRGISDSRKKKFKTRIGDAEFDFLKILSGIANSAYLRGNNAQNWSVTFDWIIENDKNYLKILEGNYN